MHCSTDCTKIDIIRHGEHALGDVICGVTDPELTEKGWQQLQRRCDRLVQRDEPWSACETSPRNRCAVFAATYCANLQMPIVENSEFSEVDFGVWEGLSFSEINDRFPGQWRSWIENAGGPAPHGGERYGDFLERVSAGLKSCVARNRGGQVLIFSHGGVIRALLKSALLLPAKSLNRFHVPHACHIRLHVFHEEGQSDWLQLQRYDTW